VRRLTRGDETARRGEHGDRVALRSAISFTSAATVPMLTVMDVSVTARPAVHGGARAESRQALSRLRTDPAWRAAVLGAGRLLAIVFVAGVGGHLLFSPSPSPASVLNPPGLVDGLGSLGDALAAPFARWDSVFYLLIAHQGYSRGFAGSSAFYPLYPLLVALIGALGPGDLVAGVLISIVALVVALRLIWLLTELELGEAYPDAPRMAVLATSLFPTAFFFTAVYTESLYLALSLGAFLMARRGRWALAGALGGLAAATRSSGVLILIALAVLYWRGPAHRRRSDALWLALVPAGLAAFIGWLALHGVSPLSPFSAEAVWSRNFAGPIGGVWYGLRAAVTGAQELIFGTNATMYWPTGPFHVPLAAARDNVELFAFLLLALGALIGALRRLPLAYGAYAAAALAVAVSYPPVDEPLDSLSRYVLVIFPLQMAAGCWLARHPRLRLPMLSLSGMALAYFVGEFATWHWVA
jgi:hypothetical protein